MAFEMTKELTRPSSALSEEGKRYVTEEGKRDVTEQPATGCCSVDLTDRDPSRINQYVKVAFKDVIAEPEGAHSSGRVYSAAHCCFTCSNKVLYNIFTFSCGLPLAFCWGCQFACVSLTHVWCLTPGLRCLDIECGTCQRFVRLWLQCIIVPCCETIGLIFSKIRITHVKADTNC